jgi:hypothetical protein
MAWRSAAKAQYDPNAAVGRSDRPATVRVGGRSVSRTVTEGPGGGFEVNGTTPTLLHRDTEARGYTDTDRRTIVQNVAPPSSVSSQRVKRLTLDLPTDVHRTLKIRSAELDVPMAELLRGLIVETLADSSALSELAERCRQPLD